MHFHYPKGLRRRVQGDRNGQLKGGLVNWCLQIRDIEFCKSEHDERNCDQSIGGRPRFVATSRQ